MRKQGARISPANNAVTNLVFIFTILLDWANRGAAPAPKWYSTME
jgi:hypothetical protein